MERATRFELATFSLGSTLIRKCELLLTHVCVYIKRETLNSQTNAFIRTSYQVSRVKVRNSEMAIVFIGAIPGSD